MPPVNCLETYIFVMWLSIFVGRLLSKFCKHEGDDALLLNGLVFRISAFATVKTIYSIQWNIEFTFEISNKVAT